ncbi:unnamed protein product [Scytosiphon promiscuus]
MGSSLLEPRRKRKRRLNLETNINNSSRSASTPLHSRFATSLPCFAVLFAFAMAAIVGVRKALKESARRAATESRAERARDDASLHPLAVLLLEQHEIESQAARFADPSRHCLSPGGGAPPSERLGLFTCLADTRFFLDALAKTLGFSSVVTVDVGNNPVHPLGKAEGVGMGGAFAGRESEIGSGALQLQQEHVEVGKDPVPDGADLVLVDVYSEALSEAAWEELIRSLMQVLSERGVIVLRGPRESLTLIKDVKEAEGEMGRSSAAWNGRIHLWEAVTTMACGAGYGVAAAMGDLDGGLIVLRHRAPGETGLEIGCGSSRSGKGAEGGSSSDSSAMTAMVEPRPLRFERLFLWATAERGTRTDRAVEGVQEKFGGTDAVRRYARRRSDRSACVDAERGVRGSSSKDGAVAGGGHVRTKRRQIRGNASPTDAASQEGFSAARECLEGHLKEHPRDVRAGFALEMILRASGGNGIEKQVSRLREKMSEESGAAGALLWRALHARTAAAVMTGLLV